METALAVLPWLLPPMLGAVIGYVTNRIAIKMLFRPLNPKRILGFRVPLTPGVIPRNRFDLARTIGRMVSEQLLSPQSLQEQLDSPQFHDNIKHWIGERRRALMQRPIGAFPTPGGRGEAGVDVSMAGAVAAAAAPAQQLAEEILAALLNSPQTARMVHTLAERITEDVGNKRLSDITNSEQLGDFVHHNVLPALKNPELADTASELVNDWLQDQLRQNKRLKEYLTPANQQALQELIRNNIPTVTWMIFNWLRQPDMSQKLVKIGQELVEDTVSHQSLMTRVILSISGKKDEAIRDMPNIIAKVIDDAEHALSTQEMRNLISQASGVALQRISGRRIRGLIGRNEQTIYWMADRATRQAFTALAETSESQVREAAGRFYEKNGDATLGEMAGRALGIRAGVVSGLTASLMLNYLTAPQTPRQISQLPRCWAATGGVQSQSAVADAADGADATTYADAATYAGAATGGAVTLESLIPLSDETGERLDHYLAEQIIEFLGEQIPELSRIMDIETLVTNRINSFDVKDVEQLVLAISGRHLRWINWFGAGLGSIIGLIQLAVNPPPL